MSKYVSLEYGTEYYGFIYRGSKVYTTVLSNKRYLFECKCGKIKNIYISNITKGATKTCGQCNTIRLNHGDGYCGFKYLGKTTDNFYILSNKKLLHYYK